MATTVRSISPLEAFQDALALVRREGLTISAEASKELEELVLSSFRLMQESRILDLPSDDPERTRFEQLARSNLTRLVNTWIQLERDRDSAELTIGGFRRTYASICPVYPCGS